MATKKLPRINRPEPPLKPGDAENKDKLSQHDIQEGKRTYGVQAEPHPALETKDGKNNGAKPTAYDDQQSYHP